MMRERRSREPKLAPAPVVMTEAKAYEEHALKELRNAGYRITMPRVQVIRALADTKRALSAYAIHEKIINGGGKIDVVSVYRILSTLQEVGLIHHIGVVDGYFPARIEDGATRKSEVLVDDSTGEVRELRIPDGLIGLIEHQIMSEGFEMTQLKVEVIAMPIPKRK